MVISMQASAQMAPAETSGGFELRIDSPSVSAIRRSLADRFHRLGEHFESGVIGLTRDGMVALRNAASTPAEARIDIERLVADENKDRATLIREIARANGRPDWEENLRGVFARRWIQRAPAGWFVQESGGTWVRKLSPPVANQSGQ
jgi:uncharacterized protein YdbL (DUF1318 family)